MKILFVIRGPIFFRFFERTVRDLAAAGHSVEVLCHFYRQKDPATLAAGDRTPHLALLQCEAEVPGFRWGPALRRGGRWRRPLTAARKLRDYASYLTPGRQASRMVIDRAYGYLPAPLKRALAFGPARAALISPAFQAALRRFERLAPPEPAVLAALRAQRPDVVVASPVIMPGSDELEYVKAAARLEIPSIVAVMSWDNLTTKGVFQVQPDLTLVWNQAQVEEAVNFHGVPRDRVMHTGAPVFDEWFNTRSTLDRAAFCRQAGLTPQQPYALYLCSSWSIAQDEKPFVEEVARGLRAHPATRGLNLLVRPHPSNAKIWEGYESDLFALWPRAGALPATTDTRQDFYHSLYYSVAAVGINTSSLIETAIVDRPCVTILAERYYDTQQAISHFQHLWKADFLEAATDIPALAELLAGILEGQDTRGDRRRQFILEFVRPWGLDRPAGRITGQIIEAVAQRRTLEQVRQAVAEEQAAALRPAVTQTVLAG